MAGSKLKVRIDSVQSTHPAAGVAIATLLKFKDDRSSRMAATMAFWAFFSVFPLFLLLVSLLGYFLPPSTKSNVLHHVAALFPLLDPTSIGNLSGNIWSIVVGGATALISGTAVMRAAEYSFNSVWDVPLAERPKSVQQIVRALEALGTIGVGLVLSTVISGFVTGQDIGVNLGAVGRGAGYVIAAALDVGLFMVAFRMLTAREVSFRDVLP
ncbi:MAG: YihY/virulence factor BrkB family protein, partial [Acidimicrobiales bacterium]